jgi:hypothetical protein
LAAYFPIKMEMRILSSVAGVCLAICPAIFAQDYSQPSPVTATQRVSAGGGKTEVLRKINARWWSQDNREVYPPSRTGLFWELDSKEGVVDFYHHRPFRLELAESLHLFMQPAQVKAILGEPNRIFGKNDDHANWIYYAANGTKVDVRFMGDGVGEAKYEPLNGKEYSVASLERELGGRSIYSVLAERATKRSDEQRAQWAAESSAEQNARIEAMRARTAARAGVARPQALTARSATIPPVAGLPPAPPQPPAPKRIVSEEALAGVTLGATRQDVVTRLGGEPSFKSTITGDDVRETMTYHRESGAPVVIRLINGKVTELPR